MAIEPVCDQSIRTLEPVVIGGVGGSGTRVVAQIVSELGWHIGDDLNHALDNLSFTFVFKRPSWYRCVRNHREEIWRGLRMLARATTGQRLADFSDGLMLASTALGLALKLRGHPSGRGIWPFIRAWRMLFPHRPEMKRGWGWKEPNSHIFLEEIAEYFPGMRYIHTIRHGLDMAFSRNQQQLHNWGWLFGVRPPCSAKEEPQASLEFWVKANLRAIETGNELGQDRFFLLNFDQLCESPEVQINRLCAFLRVEPDEQTIRKLFSIPVLPASKGRHRKHDISQFRPGHLEALSHLGFMVERVATH